MRRGFKTEAERLSAAARAALGQPSMSPLSPWEYAARLKVVVLDFDALGLSAAASRQLLDKDPESWSALTIREAATVGIVINPRHALTRQRSNLMHELAHVELKHTPSRVDVSHTGVLLLSSYSDEDELEADWLSGAMLVPREGLLRQRQGGKTTADIAAHYGVSVPLCEWRLRMTGVEIQVRRLVGR